MARILVADDNAQFVELVRATLEEAGFEVVTAYSGLAAARLVEQEELDLVILDVLMPELSGDAVAERIRALKPGLPVLFMTGDSGDQFIRAAGLPRLRKPFAEKELIETVAGLVGSGHG